MILRRFKFYSDRMNEETLEQREYAAKQMLQTAWKMRPNQIGGYNKALGSAITTTKQQIENVTAKAIGNPNRQKIIKKAIHNRASKLADIYNTTAPANKMVDAGSMKRILGVSKNYSETANTDYSEKLKNLEERLNNLDQRTTNLTNSYVQSRRLNTAFHTTRLLKKL